MCASSYLARVSIRTLACARVRFVLSRLRLCALHRFPSAPVCASCRFGQRLAVRFCFFLGLRQCAPCLVQLASLHAPLPLRARLRIDDIVSARARFG